MPSDELMRRVKKVAALLQQADALLITAGAGMSVDSGLPDFRGKEGFWRAYPPLKALGISFEEMAQPHWFAQKPEMAWAFYGHRWQRYLDATPHAGYALLRNWTANLTAGYFVLTSNVDGHFERAGFDPERILEIHGRIDLLQCATPCSDRLWRFGPVADELDIDLDTLTARGALPHCPDCAGLARPNILMFGDGEWNESATNLQHARFDRWLAGVRSRRLVILELGAGPSLPTIRRLGERIAQRSLTTLVRVNPDARGHQEDLIELPLGALQALNLVQQSLEVRTAAVTHPSTPEPKALHAKPPANVEFHPPEGVIRMALQPVIEINLDTGQTEEVDPRQIQRADEHACLDALYSGVEGWIPIPEMSCHEPCGYKFQTRIFRSGGDLDETPLGAMMAFIAAPDRQGVLAVVVGRFGEEADNAWSRIHRMHGAPRLALDCPRTPWIAFAEDRGAETHSAMLPELRRFGRLLALSWLRVQEFRDYMIRHHPDEWRRIGR